MFYVYSKKAFTFCQCYKRCVVNLLHFYGLVRSGPDSVTVCVGVYRWTWWLAFWCL